MPRYIAGRLVTLLPVMLVVGITAFLLLHLIPGDPAAVILGPDAGAAQVARLHHELGLDRPLSWSPCSRSPCSAMPMRDLADPHAVAGRGLG